MTLMPSQCVAVTMCVFVCSRLRVAGRHEWEGQSRGRRMIFEEERPIEQIDDAREDVHS